MKTLHEHLVHRTERSYNHLLAEIETISAEDAVKFACPQWPKHKWGIGQDGSIAGVVHHVAAWKEITLPIFEHNGVPLTVEEFEASCLRPIGDWKATCQWLNVVGEAWNSKVRSASAEDFEEFRDWEGNEVPIFSFVVELLEHDIQHSSQIEYLKQRIVSEK